jgi:hypothetical protein
MSANRTAGLQLMTVFLAVLCVSIFLVGCSGGSMGGANSTAASLTPAFTSAPGTAASQGATYTYQIVTAPAEAVTLALVTAPSGANLSEKTLTWTPSAAQSRVSNQFSVTATNAAGSATQSWSVTPAGTVSGSWIDTYWTSNGLVSVPFDWSKALTLIPPRALIPQPDGSFQMLQGTGNSDGTFSIPNVPGGYYWLAPAASAYWTSSSTFDFGSNGNPAPSGPADLTNNTNTFTLNFNGLDALQSGDDVVFFWDSAPPFSLVATAASPAGATSFSTTATINSNLDFSQSAPGFLLQYEPETFGTLSALMLGPELTIPNLSFTGGISETLTQTLYPSPKASFDLNIKGSAWMPLFSNVGPSSATPERADLEVTTQPFVTGANALSTFGTRIPLLGDLQPLPALFSAVCAGSHPTGPNSFTAPPGEPPITTDQDFGPVQYEDPFPPAWPRVFTFCQTASVPVPIPGSTTPISFQLVDTQSSSVPTSPISPLIGQMQNPTINGMSLFVAGSVGATGATLKWTAPSGMSPTGYKIAVFVAGALSNGVISYLPSSEFYTAKTLALLPPLQAGKTYVFLTTAILDGAANFETQPNRSALPTASVSVVSAPITIQ